MDIILTIILFVVGIVTGVYASVVGGGALVLVPLFSLLGAPITSAVATMRASALVQEFVSAVMFWRKGLIDWESSLWVSLWTMIGGYVGAQIVLTIDTNILSYIIAGIMVVLLVWLPQLGKNREIKPMFHSASFRVKLYIAIGFVLGVYGGFYGAGFGMFIIFVLVYISGWNMLRSAANARVIGFFMSLAATVVFVQHGTVDWHLFIPITSGLVVGSVIGVNWAARFGSRWVKILFVAVVIISVIKLVFYPG